MTVSKDCSVPDAWATLASAGVLLSVAADTVFAEQGITSSLPCCLSSNSNQWPTQLWSDCPCNAGKQFQSAVLTLQASLKRKWEEVGEEKTEAIKTHVKIDLDVKDQEALAKTDAKTQVSAC